MDLMCRGNLPLIEIHSDEAKGPCVLFPIHTDVNTLHEPVVYGEEKGGGSTGVPVDPRPGPLDVREANEAVEISDLRRLVDRSGKEVVDKYSKGREAPRNGFRIDTRPVRLRHSWHPES